MTDASVGGLVEKWRAKASRRYDDAERLRRVEEDERAKVIEARADEGRACADELEAALPDLLYAAGEQASIQALLSDAQIEGLTVYQQVETLLAARTAGGWRPIETAPKMRTVLLFAVTDVAEDGTVKNWRMATGSWHAGYADDRSKVEGFTPWTWAGHQLKAYEVQPTHWCSLPSAPRAQGEITK